VPRRREVYGSLDVSVLPNSSADRIALLVHPRESDKRRVDDLAFDLSRQKESLRRRSRTCQLINSHQVSDLHNAAS
jgi:hypothetical protein